jgi:ADP-ribosylglycohydrolase
MNLETILGMLEAISVGDALGMPTEFMSRQEISSRFGFVDRLLAPAESKLHKNLPYASVTDDTEQVLWLLDHYLREGVDTKGTAKCLLETHADTRGYIGPTSLKALAAIEAGANPLVSGKGGNTCGALMRTPAAVFACLGADENTCIEAIVACCIPTHNSSAALESAVAFGLALRAALGGASKAAVMEAALRGAAIGAATTEDEFPNPSSSARIRHVMDLAPGWRKPSDVMEFLYDVLGTGLPSWETCPAIFGIFLHAGADAWLAVKMGASLGGDTDTIAAMSGALCAAFAGRSNLPVAIVREVCAVNKLDLARIARAVVDHAPKAG